MFRIRYTGAAASLRIFRKHPIVEVITIVRTRIFCIIDGKRRIGRLEEYHGSDHYLYFYYGVLESISSY